MRAIVVAILLLHCVGCGQHSKVDSPQPPEVVKTALNADSWEEVVQPKGPGRKLAVIIGIDSYEHLGDLDHSVNDAHVFRDVLKSVFGYTDTDIVVLSDDKATTGAIRSIFSAWLPSQGLNRNDSLLVFFSGHGQIDGNDGYVATTDSTPTVQGWLPVSWMTNELEGLPSDIAVILDCCYSGALFKRHGQTESLDTTRTSDRRAFVGLLAGRDTPVTGGSGDMKRSRFMTSLIFALQSAAASSHHPDAQFTFTALVANVEQEMAKITELTGQRPDWGTIKDGSRDFRFYPLPDPEAKIINKIETVVSPSTWSRHGGSDVIGSCNGLLVVRTTSERLHAMVHVCLVDMRDAKELPSKKFPLFTRVKGTNDETKAVYAAYEIRDLVSVLRGSSEHYRQFHTVNLVTLIVKQIERDLANPVFKEVYGESSIVGREHGLILVTSDQRVAEEVDALLTLMRTARELPTKRPLRRTLERMQQELAQESYDRKSTDLRTYYFDVRDLTDVSLQPDELRAIIKRAISDGFFREAAFVYSWLIEEHPSLVTADDYLMRAELYSRTGALAFASDDFETVLLDNPKSSDAYIGRGRIWRELGKYDKAIADFTEAIRVNANHVKAYRERGIAQYYNSEYDKAIADVTEAIRLDPRDTVSYRVRSDAWCAKREYNNAIADLTELIRFDPNNWRAYYECGEIWTTCRDYAKATTDYYQALNLNRNNPYIYNGLANIKSELRQYDQAIALYDQAIKLDAHPFIYKKRGDVWHLKGDYEKAIADYSKAISIASQEPDGKFKDECIASYNSRAWVRATCPKAQFRDGKGAVQDAERVHELSGKWEAYSMDTLAAAYAEMGDFVQAVKCQEMAFAECEDKGEQELMRLRTLLYKSAKPYRDSGVSLESAKNSR